MYLYMRMYIISTQIRTTCMVYVYAISPLVCGLYLGAKYVRHLGCTALCLKRRQSVLCREVLKQRPRSGEDKDAKKLGVLQLIAVEKYKWSHDNEPLDQMGHKVAK